MLGNVVPLVWFKQSHHRLQSTRHIACAYKVNMIAEFWYESLMIKGYLNTEVTLLELILEKA
jgi:hypothetical protein